MCFRVKKSQDRAYLQIVENRREDGRVKQRVIATLGRLEQLQDSGRLDALLQSGARFAEAVLLVSAHAKGQLPALSARRIGAVKVFERLWYETGCRDVIEELLGERHFEMPVERALFLTVLHRLLSPGSDRAAERWREDYAIAGVEELELHHLYRAMAWLGEPLSDQQGATPFSPLCTKDRIEEALFARQRDLFSELELVFFDTAPRSTSRAKVARRSARVVTARITVPISSSWWSARCSMSTAAPLPASCGRGTPRT